MEKSLEKPDLIAKIKSLKRSIQIGGASTFSHDNGLCFIDEFLDEFQSRITELEEERDHYGGLTYGMMKEIREMQTKIIGLEEENKRLREHARDIAEEAWEAGIKWYHDEGEYGLSNTLPDKETYLNQIFGEK